MSEFELDEAAVAATAAKLFETGQTVNTEAQRARDAVTGARGAWIGDSSNAATTTQVGAFADAVERLHKEINDISEGLELGLKDTMAEDQFNQDKFNAITPTGGYTAV